MRTITITITDDELDETATGEVTDIQINDMKSHHGIDAIAMLLSALSETLDKK